MEQIDYEKRRNDRLKEANIKKIAKLEEDILRTREKIYRTAAVLVKHETAYKNKQKYYDEYERLKEEDPESAQEIWEKRKLGVTKTNVEGRTKDIKDMEGGIPATEELLDKLNREINEILAFNPIRDQLQSVQGEFRKTTKKEWGRIPNSVFKTMQDIFVPPGHRVVPKEAGIFDREFRDNLPLDACIIDPERIPEWFLEDFGIAEFPKGLTSFEKLKIKTESIPEVIRLFQHLKPMSPYDPRAKGDKYRLLAVEGYNDVHDGKIIAPRFLGKVSRDEDRKFMQVFNSAYSAHRKAEYIEKGYSRESGKIHGMKQRIESIRKQIQGMKDNDPKKDEIIEKLAAEIEELKNVTSYFKHEAYDIFKEVRNIKLKDKRGKHNPGRACARIVGALGRLDKRLPEIFEKSKASYEDKYTLSMRIDGAKAVLNQGFRDFRDICDLIYNEQKAEDYGPLFGKKSEDLAGDINELLEKLPDFDSLKIRPFNQCADKLKKKVELIKKGLEKGERETVRNEAIKAFVICKIFKIQDERENILHDISLVPEETSVEFVLNMAKRLQKATEAREVFPNVKVGYHDVYADLQEKVKVLREKLQEYEEMELTPDKRREMYKRLKKYLKKIDFPAILNDLN